MYLKTGCLFGLLRGRVRKNKQTKNNPCAFALIFCCSSLLLPRSHCEEPRKSHRGPRVASLPHLDSRKSVLALGRWGKGWGPQKMSSSQDSSHLCHERGMAFSISFQTQPAPLEKPLSSPSSEGWPLGDTDLAQRRSRQHWLRVSQTL